MSPCKLSKQNFQKFTIRGRLKKRKNCSQNFHVLRLQAAIIPQWLQIAGNSLPNWLYTGCLVFIFTVKINSKSLPPWMYVPYKKAIPTFSATFSARSRLKRYDITFAVSVDWLRHQVTSRSCNKITGNWIINCMCWLPNSSMNFFYEAEILLKFSSLP